MEFIENDLKKGGKSVHSITRLSEAPPVGEVTLDGVARSDDHALLQSEHQKWSKLWGMDAPVDPAPWHGAGVSVQFPTAAEW